MGSDGLQRLGEESGGRMRQGWFEARGEGWRGPEGLVLISLKLRVHHAGDNGFVTNSNERMSMQRRRFSTSCTAQVLPELCEDNQLNDQLNNKKQESRSSKTRLR